MLMAGCTHTTLVSQKGRPVADFVLAQLVGLSADQTLILTCDGLLVMPEPDDVLL